jgi:membrane protease subunit HflK
MAGNNGGPWGGGGNKGSGDDDEPPRPPRKPNEPQGQGIPEIDELVNKGREQLRVLMGGGNGGGTNGGGLGGVDTRHDRPGRSWRGCPLGHGVILYR